MHQVGVELDNASARHVEPLARRLAVIGEQIADLTAMKDTSSPADMMAERRRASGWPSTSG